ncbi:MAG: methyltransferase domain-containing protein [Acidobacteria bacterium]|nr:methyltransferase domain-containing protein [Acidobacteriota bacterium]MYD69306.1 methyltransferase domain-containing protein [Acidobacteriota bacterium]MYJ04763.1 methyltransferase domain-containing protein [Acidobacteriota bacterium]
MVKSKRFLLWVAGVVLAGAALVMLVGGDGESEVDLLAALLEIQPGDTAADIGAGSGWLSIEVARLVGGTGQVFATELSPQRRDDIQEAVAAAGLDNVTVVEAGERETNLAPACCDAIFMRRVYHHVGDTAALNASIRDALKPGGRFVVIEIEFSGLLSFLRGWPHWTDDAQVVAEVTAAGLDHVTTADWPIGAHYAAVFSKP